MTKKFYFVIAPIDAEHAELNAKAATYFGLKDYDCIQNDQKSFDVFKDFLNNREGFFNANLMLIGVSGISMSLCDSVYVSKDWESDDYCKVCHALAFSHGLEIVYET